MTNTVYALLAERADALDLAEIALYPHADEENEDQLCQHRVELDRWLDAPSGREALAERALLKALGG